MDLNKALENKQPAHQTQDLNDTKMSNIDKSQSSAKDLNLNLTVNKQNSSQLQSQIGLSQDQVQTKGIMQHPSNLVSVRRWDKKAVYGTHLNHIKNLEWRLLYYQFNCHLLDIYRRTCKLLWDTRLSKASGLYT